MTRKAYCYRRDEDEETLVVEFNQEDGTGIIRFEGIEPFQARNHEICHAFIRYGKWILRSEGSNRSATRKAYLSIQT